MSFQQENHYKETTPSQTVDRLKSILDEMQIEVDETWVPKSAIDTYSLRLTVKGTNLGTNGKGVTEEYARASAYAEFFERFQNNILTMGNTIWDKSDGFRYFSDERKMTALEIAQEDNAFMNMYYQKKDLENASVFQKALSIKKNHRIDYHLEGEDDSYTVLPFYSVREDKTVYLAYNIYFSYYGSNGMSAGNTPEEALVQGLSEILERYVQKKLFTDKLSIPDIPEEYIKKFPYIDHMVQKLKEQDGYLFKLKDCSLGGQFPVAALISIQKNTGKYGVKLGCHPDFGVAMERALTEATQGIDITYSAGKSVLDFQNSHVQDDVNIYNSYKYGIAQYPYEILSDTPTYPFSPVKDVSLLNNKELLDSMMEQILSMGYDILIRDVSSLGFPSYNIIIPGISEIRDVTDLIDRANNTRIYAARLLNNPELITKENCRYIIGMMELFGPSHIESSMRQHYIFPIKFSLPGEELGVGWVYLMSMCQAFLCDYRKAADSIRVVADMAEKQQSERGGFYKAVYYYMDGMSVINDHVKVMKYLQLIFSEEVCEEIDRIFEDPKLIITQQYPFHRQNMEGYCHKSDCCEYDAFLYCVGKLKERQVKNPISQDDLSLLFRKVRSNMESKCAV